MRLSPIPPKPFMTSTKRKSVTWNDGNHGAVKELLSEASALIDIFDQMSMILGPEVQLNAPIMRSADDIIIPASKWDPVLTESCNSLEEKLRNFKPQAMDLN